MAIRKLGADDGPRQYIEATLESIVSDASADNEYSLYKWTNYRRGGLLLESYAGTGGGVAEVNRMCKEQLINYMYLTGQGRTIAGSESLAWRRRRHLELYGQVIVTLPTRAPIRKRESNDNRLQSSDAASSSSSLAPYDAPDDHEACWMLEHRGALGENPLHVLVICDTPTHTKVAKMLLAHFPKLVLDIIEGSEYYGLTPLHLAVAYNNMELVQAFVEAGANVNERALGRFFMPIDQYAKPKKKTNYQGLSYLGEYALAWAATCENEAIYNYLLDRGADPNLQDTFGNMILHMVVISNKLGMYGYALRHPRKPANNEILNRAGLTPLTLACVLGRNNIFREMLELSSVEFWRFSNITCSAYPLIALDTIKPDGTTNWKSALMIVLNGETDEHLDMLEGGVVQRLLEDKWKTFARYQFLKRLGVLFLHLLVISIAVYLRPKFGESLGWSWDAKTIIRHCAEMGTLIGCGMFVFVQQGSEILSQGIVGFLTNLTRSPAKFVFLVSNVCILLCIPCRLFQTRIVEDFLLTFALPGTWFFLMFFAGAVRLTGPFVTMIYSMIAGDMVRFGIIYFIALMGFSQALYFLFKSCYVGVRDADDTNIDMYSTYWGTWMALYQMTLGTYQYSDFTKPKYSGLSMTIFVIFMILVPILLLNMLIAMMGNTYANVISKSEKEFVKQWAKIVLTLERSLNKKTAKGHLNNYAINLAPSSDGDPATEMKGLMVIKSKSKTKAQQRKGALLNWRRMGKRIIGEMRKHGCQGNQLLTVMSQNQIKRTSRRNSFPALMGEQEVEVDSADAGSTQPKGGLGEALNQLAFAHDLDIAGVTSPARPDLETMCSASEPDNETRDCLQPSPDGRTMESPRNLLPEGLSRVDEDSVVSSTMICGQDVEDRVLLTPSQHEQQEVGYEPEMEPPRYDEIDFTVVVVPSGSEYKPTELLCSGDTFPVESSCVGNTITMESSISEKIFQMETSNSGDTLPVEGTNTPKSDIEDNIIVKEENIAEKDSILTNTACQTELSVFSCTPQSSESLLTCIGEQQIKAPIIVPVIQDSDVPRLSPNHRTSPQPSYDGELVLVPARLTDKPSLSSHRSTSAPHPKNKRRGLPRRLRKLTNKVAAVKLLGAAEKNTEACSCPSLPVVNRTASPPVVDTTSLEMSSRLSSLVSTTNTTTVTTTTAIPELSASSPLTIITTTDTSVPTSNVQSPSPSHQHIDTTSLGNPLQRWSTTSLSSMAALMAWQDEDDGGDCDGSDDQVS